MRCLKKNPFIKYVYICTDSDEAGERFYDVNKPLLQSMGVEVFRNRSTGKDWGDDLVSASGYEEVPELE